MMVGEWVAAHPGYFAFWSGFWVCFVIVQLAICYLAARLMHAEVSRVVQVLREVLQVLREVLLELGRLR